jgi:hypothetical protein
VPVPLPTPTPPPTYNPQPVADSYTRLLWNHIGARIFNLLKNHHAQHELGGTDAVKIAVGGLKDVRLRSPVHDRQVLAYYKNGDYWTNGTVVAGGIHQVHFALMLPAMVVPPGPCNITGEPMKISAVKFRTDDSTVAGALLVSGNSYDIGTNQSNLRDTWAKGASMSLALTDYGSDGTYLCIDVAAG